jgi:hypothetical protein
MLNKYNVLLVINPSDVNNIKRWTVCWFTVELIICETGQSDVCSIQWYVQPTVASRITRVYDWALPHIINTTSLNIPLWNKETENKVAGN